MKFHERQYAVYALFGAAGSQEPWLSSTWQQISDATLEAFKAARDKAAVRSLQWVGVPGPIREIKFGRISHDARGAAKWTHQVSGILKSGESPVFLETEVWAPSWTVCEKDRIPPDVYLRISNRCGISVSECSRPPRYPYLCMFAVANDRHRGACRIGEDAAGALQGVLSPALALSKVRPWGYRSSPLIEDMFTDAINDLSLTPPFYPPADGEDDPLTQLSMKGWLPFPPVDA